MLKLIKRNRKVEREIDWRFKRAYLRSNKAKKMLRRTSWINEMSIIITWIRIKLIKIERNLKIKWLKSNWKARWIIKNIWKISRRDGTISWRSHFIVRIKRIKHCLNAIIDFKFIDLIIIAYLDIRWYSYRRTYK